MSPIVRIASSHVWTFSRSPTFHEHMNTFVYSAARVRTTLEPPAINSNPSYILVSSPRLQPLDRNWTLHVAIPGPFPSEMIIFVSSSLTRSWSTTIRDSRSSKSSPTHTPLTPRRPSTKTHADGGKRILHIESINDVSSIVKFQNFVFSYSSTCAVYSVPNPKGQTFLLCSSVIVSRMFRLGFVDAWL